jgi:hypothetical protein
MIFMEDKPRSYERAIRIPLHTIQARYGQDNFDDAGEDLVEALGQVSNFPHQFRCRFEFDTSHPNPWYHAMLFQVKGIPDLAYRQLVEHVRSLGLLDSLDLG